MKYYYLLIPFLLWSLLTQAQLDCNINANDYANSMTVVATLNINGQLSTNPEDQLIAHVGQECRGRARVVFEPGREVGLVFLLVRSNATNGETISFSVKPAGSTNEILTSTTLEFISDGSYGSISDPIQFITDPNRVDLGEFKAFKYFTPNGDGYHDTWEIQDVGKYQAFTLTIVNDHGKMVFQTDNYENDWDGTSQGKALPVGAYYYILQSAVRPEVYKGSISILK